MESAELSICELGRQIAISAGALFFAILKRSPANKQKFLSVWLIDSHKSSPDTSHKSCFFRPLKSPSKISFIKFRIREQQAKIELGAALVSKRKLSTINFENWPQTANYAEVKYKKKRRRRKKTWQMSLVNMSWL